MGPVNKETEQAEWRGGITEGLKGLRKSITGIKERQTAQAEKLHEVEKDIAVAKAKTAFIALIVSVVIGFIAALPGIINLFKLLAKD